MLTYHLLVFASLTSSFTEVLQHCPDLCERVYMSLYPNERLPLCKSFQGLHPDLIKEKVRLLGGDRAILLKSYHVLFHPSCSWFYYDTFWEKDIHAKRSMLSNIQGLYTTESACAALKQDGSVLTWGIPGKYNGEDSGEKKSMLVDVVKIFSNYHAFVALKRDRSIVAWGRSKYGGSIPEAKQRLLDQIKVNDIFCSTNAFVAQLLDNSIIGWGLLNDDGVENIHLDVSEISILHPIYGFDPKFKITKKDGRIVYF